MEENQENASKLPAALAYGLIRRGYSPADGAGANHAQDAPFNIEQFEPEPEPIGSMVLDRFLIDSDGQLHDNG